MNKEDWPKEISQKEWNKKYWENYYYLCISCQNECKQSSKIISLYCKNFKNKE